MANLKALHLDLDTGHVIAKNITVSGGGGGGGSYLQLSGGTLSGYLTLHADPINQLHASSKRYVDSNITNVLNVISSTETELETSISQRVAKAGDTMTGFLTLHANPVNALHAVPKQYVDSASLLRSGGTMTGYITLNGNPTNPLHATSKQYVDALVGTAENLQNYLQLAGGTMTGPLTLSGNPVNALHAVPKQYVDNLLQGLDPKGSVKVATTGNITLSGLQVIDGISVQINDRVLVKNQSDPTQNGLFTVSNLNWTRTLDANSTENITSGMYTYVESGAINGQSSWVLTTTGSIVVGSTPLTFTLFNSVVGNFVAKAGDTMTGFLTLHANPINSFHATSKQYVDVNIESMKYVHTQPTAASTWSISHSKNKIHPIVQVWISNQLVQPDTITIDDSNNITISFLQPTTGKAVLYFADV